MGVFICKRLRTQESQGQRDPESSLVLCVKLWVVLQLGQALAMSPLKNPLWYLDQPWTFYRPVCGPMAQRLNLAQNEH